MIIWNKDSDSRTYDTVKSVPRPGHSDYTSFVKYGGFETSEVVEGFLGD